MTRLVENPFFAKINVLIAFFSINYCIAQSVPELEFFTKEKINLEREKIKNAKIKTITEISLNISTGKSVSKTPKESSDTSVNNYDNNGKLINTLCYGNYFYRESEKSIYLYNSTDQLIERITTKRNSAEYMAINHAEEIDTIEKAIFKYYENGNLYSCFGLGTIDPIDVEYKYNEKGNMIEESYWCEGEKCIEKYTYDGDKLINIESGWCSTVFKYDDKGNKISELLTFSNSPDTIETIFLYDENNFPVKITISGKDILTTISYEYYYE